MSLDHLSDFFKRFKHLTPPDISIRKYVAELVNELTGVAISVEKITVSNGVVYINTSSIVKGEIYLHKETLLKRLKEKLQVPIRDIR